MYMPENQEIINNEKLVRLADMIDWLVYNNVVASRRELAKRMKYQESTLSLVVNGKQPMSAKFLNALAGVDGRLNVNWIDNGEGEMIIDDSESKMTLSREELEMLTLQQEVVRKAQDQLSEAFRIGNEKIILAQQAIVQKESDTLDTLATALSMKKARMMAIIGNNNSGNYLDSPNSGNRNSFNGTTKTKRFTRKKSVNE